MKDLGNAKHILEMKILQGRSLDWDPTKDSGRLPLSFVCYMSLEGEICGVQPHLMVAAITTFFL